MHLLCMTRVHPHCESKQARDLSRALDRACLRLEDGREGLIEWGVRVRRSSWIRLNAGVAEDAEVVWKSEARAGGPIRLEGVV